MLPQGVLGFQYEVERSRGGLTSLAGLPLYLDLAHSSGLAAAIRCHVQVAGRQGWLDTQMALAVVFLNLAGGDCVEDLERLERDSGFAAILQAIERDLLSRAERRSLKRRWRRERERTVPSPSALSAWLGRFHDPSAPQAVAGTAFIPAVTEALQGGSLPPGLTRWAGQPGAAGLHADASAGDRGNIGHGCHTDRDAQARRAALLQGVQSVSAAELLVGGAGCDALLGVP
jgi:hypothetical protein